MTIWGIEKTCDYTVMSTHHLQNAGRLMKFKRLLAMVLSLLAGTTRSLAKICKGNKDSIGPALKNWSDPGT